MTPSIDSIWEYIQQLKLQVYSEEDSEEVDPEHILNLDEDEKETMRQLKEYFKQLVDDDPLAYNAFQEMNQIDQLTFLFSKITPEKYESNKKMFHNFVNLCVKMIQKDIKIITGKLEIEHNEILSEQLKQVMIVYSNALQIKSEFEF
jgi:hypothetical protein